MGFGRRPWNPWRDLRGRTHLTFRLAPLPADTGGAILARRGDAGAIIIDPALSLEERNAALAHELIHEERGGIPTAEGMPEAWRPVVAREENAVDRIRAQRLVPVDELRQVIDIMLELHGAIEPRHVAEHFEVPYEVAELALRLLRAAS